MGGIDIINEHFIIRETVGYDFIKQVDLESLPSVLEFLKVVYNYDKMVKIHEKDNISNK